MNKTRTLVIRITFQQEELLELKAKEMGFFQISDYVRFILFTKETVAEKINKIYEMMNDGRNL